MPKPLGGRATAKPLTRREMECAVTALQKLYPDAYTYTDPDTLAKPTKIMLLFRNREESFCKANAIVRIRYCT